MILSAPKKNGYTLVHLYEVKQMLANSTERDIRKKFKQTKQKKPQTYRQNIQAKGNFRLPQHRKAKIFLNQLG